MCITWLRFGFWAQLQPNMTDHLATTCLGAARPSPGQFCCRTLKTHIFYRYVQQLSTILGFSESSLRCVPLIGLVLGPTSTAKHVKPLNPTCVQTCPTCVQTCPSCAMLDLSWAQVGSKLEPTGPSSAQVTPKLGPSRLVFGPT